MLFFTITAHAAWVRQFTPQELVDQQTRATAVFSADMVPLGQARCAGAVQGRLRRRSRRQRRWVDTKTWAWQLERRLQAGERCDFRLKPGLKASNGEGVDGRISIAFSRPVPGRAASSRLPERRSRKIRPSSSRQPGRSSRRRWNRTSGARPMAWATAFRCASCRGTRNEILASLHRGAARTMWSSVAPNACRRARR